MKEYFSDPVAPRQDKEKSPRMAWDFSQPNYDERSSCFINAGTDYGTGFKTPVGKVGSSDQGSAIPTGCRRIDISPKK